MTNQTIPIFYSSISHTPLGRVWASASDQGLWALDFGITEAEFLDIVNSRGQVSIALDENKVRPTLEQVTEYLDGERTNFDLPIDWRGMTDFSIRARKVVMDIPYGQTTSYGQLATQIGKPGAARAVGRANATNPIPLVIPCHRVIGADGGLRGYGAGNGLETKRWLLELEKANE